MFATIFIDFMVQNVKPSATDHLNSIRSRRFYCLKVQGGYLGTPPKISGSSQAGLMKLCTCIALLNAY